VLKLIFLWPRQMRPQFVTTMILQSPVGTRRMLMDLSQKFHVHGFMGMFVVEDLDKIIEAGYLPLCLYHNVPMLVPANACLPKGSCRGKVWCNEATVLIR
jgi:hypothetical protein